MPTPNELVRRIAWGQDLDADRLVELAGKQTARRWLMAAMEDEREHRHWRGQSEESWLRTMRLCMAWSGIVVRTQAA